MASESNPHVSVISVLEEVLQQHGARLEDITNLSTRNMDEASLKRNEAAGWLRKTVGVVAGKDLPAEPSEEDFRNGLRSGKILCLVLNKVQPGSVPKIVEAPPDSVIVPGGAALTAYQCFENIRNFLVAIEEMGIPTFEASDLEMGGNSSRIVHCVLALKSYSDWKKSGGIGTWKYIETSKPPTCLGTVKPFTRRNSEPFMLSISRAASLGDRSVDSLNSEQSDRSNAGSIPSLHMLLRAALLNKKREEIPMIVESMLTKVTEEYERRLASQNEPSKSSEKDMEESVPDNSLSRNASCYDKVQVQVEGQTGEMLEDESNESEKKELHNEDNSTNEESTRHLLKQKTLIEQQQQYVLELKHSLHSTKVGVEHLQMTYQEEFINLGKNLHTLAYAASGYQRVLEENRKLYNQVQDLKGSIRVYCRIRPTLNGQSNGLSCIDHIDDTTITILTPSKNGKEGRKSFTFNKIFSPSVTQAEVFKDTQPLIRSVLDGYNVCIFAYGQTGSGKTYTMSGPTELTEEGLGVNYRALGDLFDISDQRKETISYDISVQMFEIYNEQVRDLLAADCLTKILEIRNSSKNGINVPDANLVRVSSTSDVINLMNLGKKNRTVFSTAMDDRSSRSHSCLTVHVQGKDLTSGNVLHGSMHLVDLAGSDRVDKSEVKRDRLEEAHYINKSLSALGDVITSLASRSSHVPYRNSKLTQLLQDSLEGQAKTLMFVHVSPEYEALGETISTLKFAERVATVELGAAKVNKDSGEVKELKEQVKEEEEQRLKYLEFVQVTTVHAALCFIKIYIYAKERSGPLKPGVETVEETVKSVVRPVYDKYHDVPLELLKFLDSKVDESVTKIDRRVPPVIKQAPEVARGVAFEVHRDGVVNTASGYAKSVYTKYELTAKELYAKYEPKAERYAVSAWRKLNELPLFPQVASVVVPTAAFCTDKYNQAVVSSAEKGYKVASFLPLVPTHKIAKVFTEQETELEPLVFES